MGYNTVYYVCEGRGVKIMEGEECFRRGLSHDFKLPFQSCKTVFCVGQNGTYQKRTVPHPFSFGQELFWGGCPE